MKRKTIALLSAVFMVLSSCFVVSPNTIKAEINKKENSGTFIIDGSEVQAKEYHTITVNGTERTLILCEDGETYLKVGQDEPIYISNNIIDIRFDMYGTLWLLDMHHTIVWYNYDFQKDETYIFLHTVIDYTSEDDITYVKNVESLILDENNEFVIGYKTFSGKTYPILTMDEMKEYLGISDTSDPSVPTPAPTVTPTPTPTVSPAPVPTAHPTAVPTSSPDATVAPISTKVSVKKQGSYTCIYSGNKVVSKFKLSKKGVLKFKGKKNRKYKAVKKAGFIKKSKNLIFLTKKGAVYTVSPKGKKKTILKKGAKKLIFKGKFVTKVKKKKGYINVAKK